MAKTPETDQTDIPEDVRRRAQPTPDAPATVPHPGEQAPVGNRPPEDGGVAQHPIHDADVEDLGPEYYERMTDEAAKTRITSDV